MTNALYYGDNLKVLREHIADASVDLVYLDPPFNSNATYNVLFRTPKGARPEAQIEAFDDTWHWGDEAERAFDEVVRSGHTPATELLRALRGFLGENDMMAYLAMMAVRLIELRRVLKPSGSLYLHCDPTASHYLKLVLDGVFGVRNYLNEISWRRTYSHGNVGKNYGSVRDTILFYSNDGAYVWNQPFSAFTEDYVAKTFKYADKGGRRWQSVTLRNPGPRPNLRYSYTASNGVTYQPHANGWVCDLERMKTYDREGRLHFPAKATGALRLKMYLDESPGVRLQNSWDDVSVIGSQAEERLGYPTQKPLALLQRIVQTSSNPGDLVLDPFCGCGTAMHAAQKFERRWIGIDITHLAIQLIEKRLRSAFPGLGYTVHGEPKDLASALDLARRDKYEFEKWAVAKVDAQRAKAKLRGPDRGIDGVIYFRPDGKRVERAVVSVKGGENIGIGMVRDLRAVMERDGSPIGVLIVLDLPTRAMEKEAAAAGLYEVGQRRVPRLQILTLAEIFQGKKPDIPLVDPTLAFRAARRETRDTQSKMDL